MFRDVPECSRMFHVPDFIDSHLHVQKWTSVKLDLLIYFVAWQVIELSLQKEETSLMFSGKEVDFVRRLFDKKHDFNGT